MTSKNARPFRFGVHLWERKPERTWGELARQVEGLGYSTLFVADHPVGYELAPIAAASFAAAATEQLRVGILVLCNDYRHPLVAAKEAATIDLLSDGRLELGIGAGWLDSEYHALGLPFDAPSTRIERLSEAIEIVRKAWRSTEFDFDGKHYTVRGYVGLPAPRQTLPPIIVGGGGRKVLTLAGQVADIVGINPVIRNGALDRDAVRSSLGAHTTRKIDWVREAAGDRDVELQIRYFFSMVSDNAANSRLAGYLSAKFGIGVKEGMASGTVLMGSVDEVCDALQRRREEWGVSYIVIGADNPGNIEAFAPVVARLAGT